MRGGACRALLLFAHWPSWLVRSTRLRHRSVPEDGRKSDSSHGPQAASATACCTTLALSSSSSCSECQDCSTRTSWNIKSLLAPLEPPPFPALSVFPALASRESADSGVNALLGFLQDTIVNTEIFELHWRDAVGVDRNRRHHCLRRKVLASSEVRCFCFQFHERLAMESLSLESLPSFHSSSTGPASLGSCSEGSIAASTSWRENRPLFRVRFPSFSVFVCSFQPIQTAVQRGSFPTRPSRSRADAQFNSNHGFSSSGLECWRRLGK